MKRKKAIKLVEWFDEHYYIVTEKGVEYALPSVTTKLSVNPKPFLAIRRGEIGNREMNLRMREAQEKGSLVHLACAVVANGGAAVYNPPFYKRQNFTERQLSALRRKYHGKLIVLPSQETHLMTVRFNSLLELFHPRIVATEKTVYSIHLNLAGTMDYLVFLRKGVYQISRLNSIAIPESGFYIWDIKTGMASTDHGMQLAAYAMIYKDMAEGRNVKGAMILYLDANIRTGIEGTKIVSVNIVQSWKRFKNVERVWDDNNEEAKPTKFQFPLLITRKK